MFQGPLSGKTEKTQCAFLLIWLGKKGRDIFSTFTISAEETDKIGAYISKFGEYFSPQSNTVFSRYLFHKRDQRDGETIDQYITELKLLARECEYSTTELKEEMIRDRLVSGISSARVREKLLQAGSNLTLSQAVTISRAHVETQVQLRTCRNLARAAPTEVRMHILNKKLTSFEKTRRRTRVHKLINNVISVAESTSPCTNAQPKEKRVAIATS